MSTEAQQAAADVKAVARSFRAVIALADHLETIGSTEQAANEAQQRLDLAKQHLDETNALLEKARADHADKVKGIDTFHTRAKEIIAEGRAKSAELVTAAETQAAQTVEAAQQRAATIDASIAGKQTELNTVLSDIDAAQHQLDTLNGKIETTKAQLRALVS